MDFTVANQFFRHHWMEIAGLFTLAVSLWIAFGPLRHRLPRILTRFGKYSATLKLLSLSGFCWFLLYKSLVDDEPSLALNWLLGSLGIIMLLGAAFVITRKQVASKHQVPEGDPLSRPSAIPVVPRKHSSEP